MDTAAAVDFGIPGVRLDERDHICAFYGGIAQRDELLVPYLRTGLSTGAKCICIVDSTEPEALLATLDGEAQQPEQLVVVPSRDLSRMTEGFTANGMVEFWDRAVGAAVSSEGFAFARAIGEMNWVFRDEAPRFEQLVVFESELNRVLPRYPGVYVCLYDLERFGGEAIVDVLKTHPKVLANGVIIENPYYLEPDEFLARRR